MEDLQNINSNINRHYMNVPRNIRFAYLKTSSFPPFITNMKDNIKPLIEENILLNMFKSKVLDNKQQNNG